MPSKKSGGFSVWRPFTQMRTAPLRLPEAVKGRKALLTLKNGKRIIDAVSSWWVITHGHCTPAISKAVQKQAALLDQVLFADFTHAPARVLTQELRFFLPNSLNRLFFSDDGSTAVEAALKIALQSQSQRGEPQRNRFLAFKSSYHGDTAGAMSASGRGVFTAPYRKMLFSFVRADQPRFSSAPLSLWTKDFERKINRFSKNLAAVIIEPLIQGAGGMIVWPKAALERIARLTKEAGAYLVFDEVMTGFGRTGSVFALDQLDGGCHPDILCLSKGLTGGTLPLALTAVSQEIYESFLSLKKERAFFHGHSFTGNPISVAAAAANLRLLRDARSSLEKKWRFIAALNKERGERLRGRPEVKDLRLQGLVAAVEVPHGQGGGDRGDGESRTGYCSPVSKDWSRKALAKGVFLRPLGDTVYILPPYSVTEGQLHQVWDVIENLILKNRQILKKNESRGKRKSRAESRASRT